MTGPERPVACSGHESVLLAARQALAAGVSVIPVAEDGSKAPAVSWKLYQAAPPTRDDVERWFGNEGRTGIGVICGSVSGGLEMLELESEEAVEEFYAAAAATGNEQLLYRIGNGYSEMAPRGGLHLLYRCSQSGPNTKLAMAKVDAGFAVKIETRGEGGYVITAPSFGGVHPTGKPYTLLNGGFDSIAEITPEERESLFALARSLDEKPRPEVQPNPRSGTRVPGYDRPGDLYNDSADWSDILTPHDWRQAAQVGEATHWTRPGKLTGAVSATTNYRGNKLHVFSTSTDFEADKSYSPFAAYTVLNHDGDYAAAAAALAEIGFQDLSEKDPVAAALRNFDGDPGASADWPPIITTETAELPAFPTDALPPVLREMTGDCPGFG